MILKYPGFGRTIELNAESPCIGDYKPDGVSVIMEGEIGYPFAAFYGSR